MHFLLITCCAVLAGACTGDIGSKGGTVGGAPPSDPKMLGDAQPLPDGRAQFECDPTAERTPPARRVRRLTPEQYTNSIAVLLGGRQPGDTALPQPPLSFSSPLDPIDEATAAGLRYSTASGTQTIRDLEFPRALATGDRVATELVQSLKAASCWGADSTGPGRDTCLDQLLQDRGSILFRRPLTQSELSKYGAFVRNDAEPTGAQLGPDGALALAFQAMLLAPQFLFQPEIGTETGAGRLARLTPFEIASAVSLAITGGPPDATLWDAAIRGELSVPEQIKPQVARLAAGPNAWGARTFVSEYFDIRRVLSVPKAADMNSTGCQYQRSRAVLQAEMLVNDLFASNARRDFFTTLLTTPAQYYDCSTAGLFGLSDGPQTDAAPVRVELPGQRAGLLTSPAVMAGLAKREETLPVRRGKFVNLELLCYDVPSLPLEAIPPIEADVSMLTQREVLHTLHGTGTPTCYGCHQDLDPAGLAFEGYDVNGGYRTTEHGKSIDASGHFRIDGSGVLRTAWAAPDPADNTITAAGSFTDAVDLMSKIANTPAVQQCIMRNGFRYFAGREELAFDSCSLKKAENDYLPQGDYVEYLATLLSSDSFLLRSY